MTIQWEEDLPLNTGEMIWVTRIGSYAFEGESGNPLKFAYRTHWRSTIKFTYKDRSCTHMDDLGLVLLAMRPDGAPNLVALAAQFGWGNNNKYPCDLRQLDPATSSANSCVLRRAA